MISYNQLILTLESFASAHDQVKRFGAEFKEQLPNLSTEGETFPYLFVVPVGASSLEFVKQIDVDIYCVGRLRKDRENTNDVVSDTEQILTDLSVWLEDGQSTVDVVKSYSATPLNNDTLDYVAGWVKRFSFELERIAECEIPMSDVVPPSFDCEDASYSVVYENGTPIESGVIPSGGSKIIEVPNPTVCADGTVNVNKSDGTLISAVNVASGDTEPYDVADSIAVVKDTAGNILSTISIKATESEDIAVGDNAITLNTGAFLTLKAEEDADVKLKDQNGDDIVPDSVVGDTITVDIPTVPTSRGARLLKTGGADGRGRGVSELELNYTNPFGHTRRFSGHTGGYHNGTTWVDIDGVPTSKALAFPDDICIDWSQYDEIEDEIVLYTIVTNGSNINLADSITYTSGLTMLGLNWFVPNKFECFNIQTASKVELQQPFLDSITNVFLWIIDDWPLNPTTHAYRMYTRDSSISTIDKTSTGSYRCIAVAVGSLADIGL